MNGAFDRQLLLLLLSPLPRAIDGHRIFSRNKVWDSQREPNHMSNMVWFTGKTDRVSKKLKLSCTCLVYGGNFVLVVSSSNSPSSHDCFRNWPNSGGTSLGWVGLGWVGLGWVVGVGWRRLSNRGSGGRGGGGQSRRCFDGGRKLCEPQKS